MRDKNGKFTKGNKGKPKGAKSTKTKLWDILGNFIVNEGAGLYMTNLLKMMKSRDGRERKEAMHMYKDTVEFFKPRLSRVANDSSDTDYDQLLNDIEDENIENYIEETKESSLEDKQSL